MKHWKTYILSCIWSPLLVGQIILVFFFGMVSKTKIEVIMYLGWVIWAISVVFGWLPIFLFKKKGGVAKGKNYTETTVIVDTGLYSIIRHPQYTAGILFSLALIFVSQTWLITVMGVVVILLLYADIVMADRYEIEKFGKAYKDYMKKVPRVNFLLGIVRLLKRKGKND